MRKRERILVEMPIKNIQAHNLFQYSFILDTNTFKKKMSEREGGKRKIERGGERKRET